MPVCLVRGDNIKDFFVNGMKFSAVTTTGLEFVFQVIDSSINSCFVEYDSNTYIFHDQTWGMIVPNLYMYISPFTIQQMIPIGNN